MNLSELEQYLLLELFNIGVGRAADSLNKMVNQEVALSVPEVELITIERLSAQLGKQQISCVTQHINGSFEAQSLLLFPEEASLQIVKLMLGDQLSDETIAELHQEGFSEVGNIVLNACIGSLSQSINERFSIDLPEYDIGDPHNLLNVEEKGDEAVLFIKINLRLSNSNVEGFLAFLLGSMSLAKLHTLLKSMLAGL
jgi:chemotaxis protein CheC